MASDPLHIWPTMSLEECMSAIIDYRGKTPTKTTRGIPLAEHFEKTSFHQLR